jgi:hypothetical protein
VQRAYAKLGWATPKSASAQRHELLTYGDKYVTVVDSDCSGFDDGSMGGRRNTDPGVDSRLCLDTGVLIVRGISLDALRGSGKCAMGARRPNRGEFQARLAASRLRFVAPTIWLGGDMARQLDMTVLATVADTAQFGDTLEIRLRDPSNLRGLEAVLAPLLLLREQPDLVR